MSRLFFRQVADGEKSQPRLASFAALFAVCAISGVFAGYSAVAHYPIETSEAEATADTQDYTIERLVVNVPGRGILRFDATVMTPATPDTLTDISLRDEILRISIKSGMSSLVRTSEEVIPSFETAMRTYLQATDGDDYDIRIGNSQLYQAGI